MTCRVLLPALFPLLAGCAQRSAVSPPGPPPPERGPEASIQVRYDGSILHRHAQAIFTVQQSAYVLVGHLGGDGAIRVVYPRSPRESGRVHKGRLYSTITFRADYDAAPGFWFMRPIAMRGLGAQLDSYDGGGHGFVFLIASHEPLQFEQISDGNAWDEFEGQNYEFMRDPRALVKEFAELLAPGGRYTLDFAASNRNLYTPSYSAIMDCALGYLTLPWHVDERRFSWSYSHPTAGCGYAARRYSWWPGPLGSSTPAPAPTPKPPNPGRPDGTPVSPPTTPRDRPWNPDRHRPLLPKPGPWTTPTAAERAMDVSPRRFNPERYSLPERWRETAVPSEPRRHSEFGFPDRSRPTRSHHAPSHSPAPVQVESSRPAPPPPVSATPVSPPPAPSPSPAPTSDRRPDLTR